MVSVGYVICYFQFFEEAHSTALLERKRRRFLNFVIIIFLAKRSFLIKLALSFAVIFSLTTKSGNGTHWTISKLLLLLNFSVQASLKINVFT